jgi:hypothetical protein
MALRWIVIVLLLSACADEALDPGLEALVRVSGAQYIAGALPPPGGGPRVESARVPHQRVRVGSLNEHVTGNLAPSATAVLIGLAGDRGHWLVLAGVPTAEEPELPSFDAQLSLSRALPPGPLTLQLSAADARGRIGPRTSIALEATDPAAQAALAVRLRWDNAADLDLHVVDPDGTVIWARNINSLRDPESAPDSSASQAGILDIDSNADCATEDHSEERVLWRTGYPAGQYRVRVATASLCGETSAHWSVEVHASGRVLASASGLSVPSDTRFGAGAGAGILALTFDAP